MTIASAAIAAEPEHLNWTIDGVDREAILYAPASLPESGKSPVVFAFHGHGGHMDQCARQMHLQKEWPAAYVVYMQGLNTPTRLDPEGKKPGWQRAPGEQGDRDLKFFDAVLATLREKFKIDDHRIYATGFSNGSVFTFLLWGERPSTFAAYAPCSGPPMESVKLTVPKPVFIVTGKEDKIVPLAIEEAAIRRARELNHATADSQPGEDGIMLYKSTTDTPVQTLIHPGGHILPTLAPKAIVKFFQAHELRN